LPFARVLLMSPAVVNLLMNWAFCNCALSDEDNVVVKRFQNRKNLKAAQSISSFDGGYFITTSIGV
jgi:hypothetical protein